MELFDCVTLELHESGKESMHSGKERECPGLVCFHDFERTAGVFNIVVNHEPSVFVGNF